MTDLPMLMWFDQDKPLEEKIRDAAKRFAEKFGVRPNLCLVHPADLDGNREPSVDGITVRPDRSVLRYHLLIGVGDEEDGDAHA